MKFSDQQIRSFWRDQAQRFGDDHRASWNDRHAIALEIAEISKWLRDGMRVIDVGCANGFSTLSYAQQFRIDIKGVDYIPEMIAAAKDRLAAQSLPLAATVAFAEGNILDLQEPDGLYDAAIVTRVVINLGQRERQVAALREAARVVRTGGRLLVSEATQEGLRQLNAFRAEWGLGPIPEPQFNNYVDAELMRTAASDLVVLEEISNFASTYFVGTRVLKPLLAGLIGNKVDPSRPDMEWNRFFATLPSGGDYGTQKLFVFRRK
ncbi:class I SAM-dependent methyltransferase [Bradyrhizobium liaoningense]|uniref:class I SAM-dependent methyltransferase n=1 Tax=Bradyrhizobium liaoningense TaxID=43992 RepID=UPI001BA5CFAA|nr:class I SAM-dependent methyltransferase [Bradyrhizobium liaoningense]MBR0713029.1 class I SAM-dependent methyltransferase [Bradyrhizobium liaoningense]